MSTYPHIEEKHSHYKNYLKTENKQKKNLALLLLKSKNVVKILILKKVIWFDQNAEKIDIIEKNPEDPHDCDYIFL